MAYASTSTSIEHFACLTPAERAAVEVALKRLKKEFHELGYNDEMFESVSNLFTVEVYTSADMPKRTTIFIYALNKLVFEHTIIYCWDYITKEEESVCHLR